VREKQKYNKIMNTKVYTSAPLPFMGQKRRFIKLYKSALKEFPEAKIFVDLFGGSGLLSHTTKHARPNAMVVYNDYDDYHIRLINVEKTNAMLEVIRGMVKGCPEDKKLSPGIKAKIISYLKKQEQKLFKATSGQLQATSKKKAALQLLTC
jgi:hypothetical protein